MCMYIIFHYSDVIMSVMAPHITSLTIVYSFVQAQITENIKAPRHWPLWGEFIGDRWSSRTKTRNVENISSWWRHHATNERVLVALSCEICVSPCVVKHLEVRLVTRLDNHIIYRALPIYRGLFSSNNSREIAIAVPLRRCMGVSREILVWPKIYLRI